MMRPASHFVRSINMATTEETVTGAGAPNGAVAEAPTAPSGAQALERGSPKRRRDVADGAIEEALAGEKFIVSSMVKAARNFGAVVQIAQHAPVVVEKRGVARAVIISMRRMAFYESLVARYAEDKAVEELGGAIKALAEGRQKDSYARRRGSRRFAAHAPKSARLARQYAGIAGDLAKGGN